MPPYLMVGDKKGDNVVKRINTIADECLVGASRYY